MKEERAVIRIGTKAHARATEAAAAAGLSLREYVEELIANDSPDDLIGVEPKETKVVPRRGRPDPTDVPPPIIDSNSHAAGRRD